MALDDFSRFQNTPPIIVDGQETYGTWVPPSFITTRPSNEFIGVFKVSSALEGRPDLISYSLYGTANLDWILIAFNNIIETLNWPKAGSLIEYPLETIVLPELL